MGAVVAEEDCLDAEPVTVLKLLAVLEEAFGDGAAPAERSRSNEI